MIRELETDYLIIGAGAMGMAFADELVTRSRNLRIILVDRRAKPGGHWNDAYRFVTLHQPAAYYGVNSAPLGEGGSDLASGAQIQAYYERVLKKLCATGRVTFFAQCKYEGEGRFRSLVPTDQVYQVSVRRKTVDATYSQMEVPSTHPPKYAVADGVSLVPINALAHIKKPWSRYVVIGAGKTGMDAALYLLEQGVAPDAITWIISNDCWFFKRRFLMPEEGLRVLPQQLRCLGQIKDVDDFYRQYEAAGWMFRLDTNIWPTRFRCATVSTEELRALQGIPHKVRLGRVSRIDPTEIVLERGTLATDAEVLHIDCTAHGLVSRPARPVFEGDRLTLQPLWMCQQVFSSALTAAIELRYQDDATKNAMSKPIPHPMFPPDQLTRGVATIHNALFWLRPFGWWLLRSRLSVFHHVSWFLRLRVVVAGIRWLRPAAQNIERVIQELRDEI